MVRPKNTAGADSPIPDALQLWSTPGKRVTWLVETRFAGNRSAFAEAVGVSHTAINKVVRGAEPGRRLLTAITDRLNVSPAWLLRGDGLPFPNDQVAGQAVPVARQLLPGPAWKHGELLTDYSLDASRFFTASQYWYCLGAEEPILYDPQRGFREGDYLLLQTDPRAFPAPDRLWEHLCAVKSPGGTGPAVKLGLVSYFEAGEEESERFEVNTFDLTPPKAKLVEETVVRRYPDGEFKVFQRQLKIAQFRGHPWAVELSEQDVDPTMPKISYEDIVAVWTRLLYRPKEVSLE